MGERQVGKWVAINDVEEATDGVMYYAVHEYVLDDKTYARPITEYELTGGEAWNLVHSHNKRMGFE